MVACRRAGRPGGRQGGRVGATQQAEAPAKPAFPGGGRRWPRPKRHGRCSGPCGLPMRTALSKPWLGERGPVQASGVPERLWCKGGPGLPVPGETLRLNVRMGRFPFGRWRSPAWEATQPALPLEASDRGPFGEGEADLGEIVPQRKRLEGPPIAPPPPRRAPLPQRILPFFEKIRRFLRALL